MFFLSAGPAVLLFTPRGCFLNQVLLRSHRKARIVHIDSQGGIREHECDNFAAPRNAWPNPLPCGTARTQCVPGSATTGAAAEVSTAVIEAKAPDFSTAICCCAQYTGIAQFYRSLDFILFRQL